MKALVILAIVAPMMWLSALPASAQAPPSVSGTVQQYLLTPHGEVDGLLLSDGTAVKFPKHLGASLTFIVKPGDPVAVIGFAGPVTPQGRGMKALTVTNTTTKQVVVDQPPASRPLRPELRGLTRAALNVSGTVTRFIVNPKGDVDGLILSGGEQVKFKPHRGAGLVGMLGQQSGAVVQVTGLGTRNAFGTVVAADSVMVGGQAVRLAGKRK